MAEEQILDVKIEAAESRTDARFGRLEGQLDSRFAAIDGRFANLEARMDVLPEKVAGLFAIAP